MGVVDGAWTLFSRSDEVLLCRFAKPIVIKDRDNDDDDDDDYSNAALHF